MDPTLLAVRMILFFWSCTILCRGAASLDPWALCSSPDCKAKFGDGHCDKECSPSECLKDGFDCLTFQGHCEPSYTQYCRDHYGNSHCEHGCNNSRCGWDGSDCFVQQSPLWANGTLILQTKIPPQDIPNQNRSLLWSLSTLLQTTLKLRGVATFDPNRELFTLDPQELADLLSQRPAHNNNGSVLFLQVDNRPCSLLPSTCFQSATEAADFLPSMMQSKREAYPEIQAVVAVRGVREELGDREPDEANITQPVPPSWLWAVVGMATGLALALAILAVMALIRIHRRRRESKGGGRLQHRSAVTDNDHRGQAWTQHAPHREDRGRATREKEQSGKKKRGRGKENGKRRREPLGEDAIGLRPLKKELNIGSDTDVTQSSMEDIQLQQEDNSICDHRTQGQKPFQVTASQLQGPPRRHDRNTTTPHNRTPNHSAPVQWCGPDGSVVLIRAVRSGLDRVVLELLRAGVPVNNTDHTGRSALHWACSVNNLPLARTLIRYGAAVDLQDYKGETALFLSALYGCYDTTRFLLLHGASQNLADRRGRHPIDAAREGLHHHILELLLAYMPQRGPASMELDMPWDDRGYPPSSCGTPPGLPGRSASFSGVISHWEPPNPSDWSTGRGRCVSPQHWRPQPNQSATALVSPRILGRPSRPISTLQEVTSEEEDSERPQEATRAATPHFLSPHPAPRQRSFSCTQHALQRRSGANQSENPISAAPVKSTNEHVERVVSVTATKAPSQSEVKLEVDFPSKVQSESGTGRGWNCNQKTQSESKNHSKSYSETPAHTVL